MIRAFLAVELPDDLRDRIAAFQQDLKATVSAGAPTARVTWTAAATMHLTVKFLGDIRPELVEPLHDAIRAAVSPIEPIDLPLERFGAFPHVREPRTLWLGAADGWRHTEAGLRLTSLHGAIDDAVASVGLPKDHRPYAPHLTVARVRSGDRHVGRALSTAPAISRTLTIGTLRIQSIVLMKSELGPSGAVHTRLWEAG